LPSNEADPDGCVKIDKEKVRQLIENILSELTVVSVLDNTLLSRCYFVSFFDDLLAEMIKQMKVLPIFNNIDYNHQFQKLLDDGGIGQYVLSDSFNNTTPGKKEGSNSNFKNYEKYTDGS
jgi:hypothetical protein